jgi:hypothetical protein
MHRRHLLAGASASLLLGGAASAADEKPRPDLSVSIAIGKRFGTSRSIEYRDAQSHFHVVLRNESDKPLRLWREWCSWGYFCLTFAATTADGKVHEIKKGDQAWTKNYPDFEQLESGDTVVREVFYGSGQWENFPRNPGNDAHKFKLQAFYATAADAEAAKENVWTGKIESPVMEVAIWGLK